LYHRFLTIYYSKKLLKKGLPWGKRALVASLPGAHGEPER
jgi:hypothetical protein